MELFGMIVFFILGIVFGSFFNVIGLRLPKNVPFHKGRSYCPHCKQQLRPIELIPVISYFIQGGKCRHCQGKIAPIYPLMELLTGSLFAFSFWQIGFDVELMTALLLVSFAIILTVTDITYMLLPNKILLFFLPLFITLRIISPLDPWYDSILGAVVGYVLIMIIILVSKGGMGAGDMKLLGCLGIILGWKLTLLAFFIGTFAGALVGGLLMGLKKLKRGEPMPFGPYLLLGAIISFFFGEQILTIYLNLF